MPITPMHPYIPQYRPISNITPFTYRDGITYVEVLEGIRTQINEVVAHVNDNFNIVGEEFNTEVNRLLEAVDEQLDLQSADIDSKILTASNNINDGIDTINTLISNQDIAATLALNNAIDYVNIQISNMTTLVNNRINEIINESVTVQDAVVHGILNDSGSTTRQLADTLYLGAAAGDSGTAINVLDVGSQTRAALNSNFAAKSIETIVDSGRLSSPNVVLAINSEIDSIDNDSIVSGLISDSGSDTRLALKDSYDAIRPVIKAKSFRPIFNNFNPGLNATYEGSFYFDGVEIHVDIQVKIDGSKTGPMGTAPEMYLPNEGKFAVDGSGNSIAEAIAIGTLSNAGTGIVYWASAIGRNLHKAFLVMVYNDAGKYGTITASAPFSWGILSSITMKYSYKPLNGVAPLTFSAFGDSISRFQNNTINISEVWPKFVINNDVAFSGGYAVDSGTSAMVLSGAKAISSDYGVCMVGVNDIAGSVALGTTLSNIEAIRNKVDTDKFILCKIAPYDANPTAANAMNSALVTLAGNKGWIIIDPFNAYRAGDGKWTSGASSDGVHPTLAVSQAAGLVVRAAIIADSV